MSGLIKFRFLGPMLVVGLSHEEPINRPYFTVCAGGTCTVYSNMFEYSKNSRKTHNEIYRGAEIVDFDNLYEFELVKKIHEDGANFYVFKIPDTYYFLKLVGNFLTVVDSGVVIEK